MTDQTNATGHTGEPWAIGQQYEHEVFGGSVIAILCGLVGTSEEGCVGLVLGEHQDCPETKANAARIVQCVNALAGVPDPAAFVARARGQEAAIAELQEMVNVCEMDRNRALAELARLRPLAELYPLAWEECKKWRGLIGEHANKREWGCTDINGVWRWVAQADAHDKARAERGVE